MLRLLFHSYQEMYLALSFNNWLKNDKKYLINILCKRVFEESNIQFKFQIVNDLRSKYNLDCLFPLPAPSRCSIDHVLEVGRGYRK